MTWEYNTDTGEIIAPWGEVVETKEPPYQNPDDVQAVAERLFREESMTEMDTERIADYAQAWMGDIVFVNDDDE